MKKSTRLPAVLLATFFALQLAPSAKAGNLTLNFATAFQSGVGGQTLTFDATASNGSGSTLYLNGDNTYVDWPLTLDDSLYGSYPYWLDDGGSYSAALFTVFIPVDTAPGQYSGYFAITGGDTAIAGDTIAVAQFNVDVESLPEPSSFLLLATGMAGLAAALRRRRRP